MLHGEGRHLPCANDDDRAARQVAERFLCQVGAQGDERVRRSAERGLLPRATARAGGRVEQASQLWVGGLLALGTAERLAYLGIDLCLTQHHRVEPARHGEQVVRRVLLPMRVQRLGELLRRDGPGFGEEPFQGQESGVVAGDVAVHLDAVARGQDHGPVDALQVVRPPIRLGEVVVGEGEPLQQLDRCATEGDPEGEDGHEQVGQGF